MVKVPTEPPGISVPPFSIATPPITVPWPDSVPNTSTRLAVSVAPGLDASPTCSMPALTATLVALLAPSRMTVPEFTFTWLMPEKPNALA